MNNLYLHIGASKTGSTWLYECLVKKHPEIEELLEGQKRVIFWNQDEHNIFYMKKYKKNIHKKSLEWYKQLFQNRTPNIMLADMSDGNSWIPIKRIQEIKYHFPSTKITYAIRNPITTIWSHTITSKHAINLRNNEPIVDYEKILMDSDYIYNTHYDTNIQNWINVFGDQVLIYFFTEINQPIKLLQKISNHLKIDSEYWNSFTEQQLSIRINARKQNIPIPKSVLSFLCDYYSNRINWLEQYFDKDLSHWLIGKE